VPGVAPGIPLSQAIDEYLQWLELTKRRSLRTVAEYRADLARFAEFAGGDDGVPDVAGIDRELLDGYRKHVSRLTVARRGERVPIAASTHARRLVALRNFLRFAMRERWLPPGELAATLDMPALPERLPKPLDDAARDRLLAALPADTLAHKRDRAFILFLLSTGARISEALRLDRPDWTPGRMHLVGKGNRERVVFVTDKAARAVEDYLAARTDTAPALFIGFQPARQHARGNRLTVSGAEHICRQLALRLGITAFHPHQLRHTFGTWLQETMGDARLTADVLGHKGLATVTGYTKITDLRRHEAYEQLQRRGL
jgi:site-specific recombinase XerD